MVRGLEIFREHFRGFADQYVLIGGTAATLAMQDMGLEFRATKDLDVVLHVEALTAEFGSAFWAFVEGGGYQIRESSTGKPCFYRFQKPKDPRFPAMVELFARAPDALRPIEGGHLTPIPFDQQVSSLSAILLDDDYYTFIMAGRHEQDGLSWVAEDRLIPLKAVAWLELTERKVKGEQIDSANVQKHVRDVLRLSQLLTSESRVAVSGRIAADMRRFIETAATDDTLQPKAIGLNADRGEFLARIAAAYGV